MTKQAPNAYTAKNQPFTVAIDENSDYMMSTTEVGKRLGCNAVFVGELIECGLLPAMRFGRKRRVRNKTLNKFMADFDGCNLHDLVKIAHHNNATG